MGNTRTGGVDQVHEKITWLIAEALLCGLWPLLNSNLTNHKITISFSHFHKGALLMCKKPYEIEKQKIDYQGIFKLFEK